MPASYGRMAGLSSLLGGVLVFLGIGIAGVVTPSYDATRELISAAQPGPYGFLVTLSLAAAFLADLGPAHNAGGLIQRFLTVTTWAWNIVIGAWLLLRPATSPVGS